MFRSTAEACSRTAIVASGTIAPDSSVIWPLSVAMDCAKDEEARPMINNILVFQPPLDAVQEFRIDNGQQFGGYGAGAARTNRTLFELRREHEHTLSARRLRFLATNSAWVEIAVLT
jgi:hypothetical protein